MNKIKTMLEKGIEEINEVLNSCECVEFKTNAIGSLYAKIKEELKEVEVGFQEELRNIEAKRIEEERRREESQKQMNAELNDLNKMFVKLKDEFKKTTSAVDKGNIDIEGWESLFNHYDAFESKIDYYFMIPKEEWDLVNDFWKHITMEDRVKFKESLIPLEKEMILIKQYIYAKADELGLDICNNGISQDFDDNELLPF